jgi:hypothetical protein
VPSKQSYRPEIDVDLDFQQRDWRMQHIGWALLALLVAAGLAGLLGPGPLSNVHARGSQGLEVEYERFVRHGAESEIRVSVPQPASGRVRIAITREYLESLNLQQVLPSPALVRPSRDSLVYEFERAIEDGPVQATFVIQPGELGSHVARVAVDAGSSVAIRQFTYP